MLKLTEFIVKIGKWKIFRMRMMLIAISLAATLILMPDERSCAGIVTDMPMRIRARIEGKTQIVCAGLQIENVSWLQGIYEAREYRPAWTTDIGLSTSGQAATTLLAGCIQEGFDPETYHLSLIRSLDTGIRNGGVSPDRLVDLDMLLTHGVSLYYVHLSRGRVNPEVIDAFWASSARPVQDIASMIGKAIERDSLGDLLASASPAHPGFRRLREALGILRRIQEKGGWGQIPSGGKIQAGENDPRIPAIRKRLSFTDGPVFNPKTTSHSLEAGLIGAVKRFQKRHGLHPDGVIGPQTILNMNVPVEDRIRQIELNLERWRWLNGDWGRRYLIVNIADYSLEAVDDGKVTLDMRVIVGQTYRRTPVFSERLRYITLNPFWNVPKKIAVEDKLPIIKKDPGYLLKNHIHVYSARDENGPEINPYTIDWNRLHADYFPYRLRQDPGARNALGRIKFLLPNKYAIYLHDSPQRELFHRTTRGYSSGCIRLEKPVDLAVEVLKNTPGWNQAKILSTIQSGVTTVIPVKEEIMVYLLYWTAWVDETGTINFREDIYDRDRPLWIAIQDVDKAYERMKEVSLGNLVIKPDAS